MGEANVFDALLSGPDAAAQEPQSSLSFDTPAPVGHVVAPAARMLPSGMPPGGSPMFPLYQETPPPSSLLMPQPGVEPTWKDTLVKSLIAGLGGFAAAQAHLNPSGILGVADATVQGNDIDRFKIALLNANMLRQQQADQDAQIRAKQAAALNRLKIVTGVQQHIEGLTSAQEIADYKSLVHDYVAPFGVDVDKLPTMPSTGALMKMRKGYQDAYDANLKTMKESGINIEDQSLYDVNNPNAPSIRVTPNGPALKLGALRELAYGSRYDPTKMPLVPKKGADTLTESGYIEAGLNDWKGANKGIDPPPPVRDKIIGQRRAAWAAMGRAPEKAAGDGAGQLPLSAFTGGGQAADVSGPVVYNEHALDGLTPMQAEIVKRLNDYKFPISATRNPSKEMVPLIARAGLRDPSFDPNQYASRQKTMLDYKSGATFRNIQALNAATRHLQTLAKAADALDNSDYPAINGIVNFVRTQTGDNSVTNFKTAATVVESELAKVLKGSGATDQEIKAWRDNLGADMSPEQLRGAITTAVDVMGGRLASLHDGYVTGMGRPVDFQILYPTSQRILKQMGFNPQTLEREDTSPASSNSAPPARNAPADMTGGHKVGDVVRLKSSGKIARIISVDPTTGQMKFQPWDFFANLRGLSAPPQ